MPSPYAWAGLALLVIATALLIALLVLLVDGRSGSGRRRGRAGAAGAAGGSVRILSTGPGGITLIDSNGVTAFLASGAPGATGPTGPGGVTGAAGETGATGEAGGGGAGAGGVIPFASGEPVVLTTVGGGLDTGAVVAFGASASGVTVSGGAVDLTGAPGAVLDMAWIQPRPGTLTSLNAFFSNTAAVALGGVVATVHVQLYASGSNLFVPIFGASVDIPFTGNVVLGTFGQAAVDGLNIPLNEGTRYLLVASLTAVGALGSPALSGYLSGGITVA